MPVWKITKIKTLLLAMFDFSSFTAQLRYKVLYQIFKAEINQ